jgi:molybdopterin-biosynthesis enzyme MoeA-like protein
MAGVPSIMRGMLQDVVGRIQGGDIVRSVTVRGRGVREGDIAAGLAKLELDAPGVSFGSYPWFAPEGFGLHLVARTSDADALVKAGEDLKALIRACGAEPEIIEDAI